MPELLPHFDSDARERAERDWLSRLRSGDEGAFEQIFRAFVSPLCSFAFSYVRAPDIAEEIVQDLFCWMWEQRYTLDMPRGVRSYLFSAVRNRSLNALRDQQSTLAVHARISREALIGDVTEIRSATDGALLEHELADALARAVASMPPRCREVYTLIREQHMSYAETADVLGISPNTVEVHMTRALRILKTRLGSWTSP